MRAALKRGLQNAGLVLGSLVATFAVCELVVFRFILPPDDLLPNVTINSVVRYQPSREATFRHPDGRQTLVRINADGWNTTRAKYERPRQPGTLRVAVIGDSYVHGSFVNVQEGFPEILEAELNDAGVKSEVYRFGMDGAPLSQYLHMLRREVRGYRPDIVVVPLIHNDFDESYRLLKTRYASSFLKVTKDAEGQPVDIWPADFKPGLADVLRRLNTFRYLYYKTNAYLVLKSFVSRYFWGGAEEFAPEFVSSAVDIRKISDHKSNRFFAHYAMNEMKKIAEADGIRLVFVMDGVREAIYEKQDPNAYEVGRLNRIALEVTRELGLPFLDLQQTFADDYARNAKRFEFAYDWHWNKHANDLVGKRIARLLLDDPRLIGVRPRAMSTGTGRRGS